MGDTVSKNFNEGAKKTLHLKSSSGFGWLGPFGSRFSAKIPVTELENGLYKIAKEDWDETVGPIFDRMRAGIHNKDKIDADKYRAIAHGYKAMNSEQTGQFHILLTAFGIAAKPERLNDYPGTVETNKYLAYWTDFVETLNGPENSVLVNGTQLQALANSARGAMLYAKEGDRVADKSKDFYDDYDEDREDVEYNNGLGIVNKISGP